MIDYCLDCLAHDTCEFLCKEAEVYAAQDHVRQNNRLVYTGNEPKLDYLAQLSTLSLAEMQTDVQLGIQEWHYVKKAGLTDQQMQCMWLYFWDKLIQVEIGEKLGITQQTVQQHLEYGKKKLIKMLKSE